MDSVVLSVVIATRNRADTLGKCLKCIEAQTYSGQYEVLIVDDGSDDGNKKKLHEYQQNRKLPLKVFYKQSAGPASARNVAFKNAAGRIVLIINDDTLIERDFFSRHVDFHDKHPELTVALHGPFITNKDIIDSPAMKWLVHQSRLHFDYESIRGMEVIPWNYFWTCNISLKTAFVKDNELYFDEDFAVAAWEDVEYGWRAYNRGLRIYFQKELVAYHDHSFELKELLSRFYNHGRGLYILKGKIPNEYLPPLARVRVRLAARILLAVIMAGVTIPYIIKMLERRNVLNNLLMQVIVIYMKLQGYDYERKMNNVR